MEAKRWLTTGVVVGLLVLTGAGCKNPLKKESSGSRSEKTSYSSSSDDEKQSPGEAYREATDYDLADSENSRALRKMVEEVFGDVKTTSFSQFPSPNSVTAEYQAKRATAPADKQAMENLLKKKGYKIDFSGLADGAVAMSATDKNNTIWITFQIGESKIGGVMSPLNEMNGETTEE